MVTMILMMILIVKYFYYYFIRQVQKQSQIETGSVTPVDFENEKRFPSPLLLL